MQEEGCFEAFVDPRLVGGVTNIRLHGQEIVKIRKFFVPRD